MGSVTGELGGFNKKRAAIIAVVVVFALGVGGVATFLAGRLEPDELAVINIASAGAQGVTSLSLAAGTRLELWQSVDVSNTPRRPTAPDRPGVSVRLVDRDARVARCWRWEVAIDPARGSLQRLVCRGVGRCNRSLLDHEVTHMINCPVPRCGASVPAGRTTFRARLVVEDDCPYAIGRHRLRIARAK